ncbi:Syntaxin-7 [Chamberlinius hualienensis]
MSKAAYHLADTYDVESEFERLVQAASYSIQKITFNVRSMQQLVNNFGTTEDGQEFRVEFYKTQRHSNQLAHDVNGYLKQLTTILKSSRNTPEHKQRKMQKERLAHEFETVLKSFQEIQTTVAKKEKESVSKFQSASGPHATYLENSQPDQVTLQLQQDSNLEFAQEQGRALHQIENDIVLVNQIFKDLARMVNEQGEVLDTIEDNIVQASEQIRDGKEQLTQANEYQTAARKKKLIIFFVIAIVLAVIITVVVFSVPS